MALQRIGSLLIVGSQPALVLQGQVSRVAVNGALRGIGNGQNALVVDLAGEQDAGIGGAAAVNGQVAVGCDAQPGAAFHFQVGNGRHGGFDLGVVVVPQVGDDCVVVPAGHALVAPVAGFHPVGFVAGGAAGPDGLCERGNAVQSEERDQDGIFHDIGYLRVCMEANRWAAHTGPYRGKGHFFDDTALLFSNVPPVCPSKRCLVSSKN